MALKATVYKAKVSVSNLNIHHYEDYSLTIARHPSETDQRMMIRLAVFALWCQEGPVFTKGISDDSEPDLWKIGVDGSSVEHWIELGQVEEKRLRQACGRAQRVSIYTYQDNMSAQWWANMQLKAQRFENLSVTHLAVQDGPPIDVLAEKGMNLGFNIQDDEIWATSETQRLCIKQNFLKRS